MSSTISRAGVGERQCRYNFYAVAEVIQQFSTLLAPPQDRLNDCAKNLPYVTALLDGSPIPCRMRGGDHTTKKGKKTIKNWCTKYKFRCVKVEMWVSLQGKPLAFRGPIHGVRHDMQFWKEPTGTLPGIPFPHFRTENFLADHGYWGKTPHTLLPFKKIEVEGMAPIHPGAKPTLRRYWNKVHSLYRSRVERCFAWWTAWKFTQQCNHGELWLRMAMHIMVAVQHFIMVIEEHRPYDDIMDDGRLWGSASHHPMCTCDGQR